MSNSWENKPQKNTQGEIKEMFGGMAGGIKEASRRALFNCSYRFSAAEAGLPIKKHDLNLKDMNSLQKEEDNYIKSVSGKTKEDLREKFEDYKIPEFSQFIKKDKQTGKLLQNFKEVDNYKLMTILAPLQKMGVRDFREAKNFEMQLSSSGKVVMRTEMGNMHEQAAYDVEKLAVSFLAESEDKSDYGKEFTMLPYAHMDNEGHMASKSLIVLNQEQREKLIKFVFEKI